MNDQINGAGKKLENAFQLFNQFSEKLADSYGDLVSQVARLSKELADERNKRLIQLAEKERLARQLESLFDALPAGVVVLDAEGGITQTNRVAHDMLELKSKHEKNNKWETIAADTFTNDGDELRLNDGRWISLSACQLNEAREKIILISDVSETHILHEMLNRQQRLSSLGEMIASLAHQIRTPLASALLNISNSNHPANNEDRRLHFTEKAKERLHHLERMVDDMLIFAKGDVSESEYMSAEKFFTQLKSLLEPDYKSQQVSLHMDNNLKDVSIQANLDALLSAMQNLVDNAIAACESVEDKTTNIEITAYLNSENEFEINIKDNGCGMTQQTTARVLEPFFTTRINGTGLGLAVVNATVNRYNGQLCIDSKPGEGSNINIQFPRAQTNGLLHSSLSLIDIDTNSNKQTIHTDAKVTGDQR